MDLNEYIKQSYSRPNKAVLEALDASEELIEYLLHTPWNTNMSMVDSIAPKQDNIWFKATLTADDYESATTGKIRAQLEIVAEESQIDEILNGSVSDYYAIVNGEGMLIYSSASGGAFSFHDTEAQSVANIRVTYDNYQGSQPADAYIVVNADAPIIGEVKIEIVKKSIVPGGLVPGELAPGGQVDQ